MATPGRTDPHMDTKDVNTTGLLPGPSYAPPFTQLAKGRGIASACDEQEGVALMS